MRLLAKIDDNKLVTFFYIMGVNASKLAKAANIWLDAILFVNFDVFLDFNDVIIKIWKKMKTTFHSYFFARSESAIRI